MCCSATFTFASSGKGERHTLLERPKAWQWGRSLPHSCKSRQRTVSVSDLTVMTCLVAARCFSSKVQVIHGSEPKQGKGTEIKHRTFQFRPSDQQRLQEDWNSKEIKETILKTVWKSKSLYYWHNETLATKHWACRQFSEMNLLSCMVAKASLYCPCLYEIWQIWDKEGHCCKAVSGSSHIFEKDIGEYKEKNLK